MRSGCAPPTNDALTGQTALTPSNAPVRSRRSSSSGCDRPMLRPRVPRASAATRTSRSGLGNGSGRISTASTTVKIATFAPMPSASVRTAMAAKPGAAMIPRRRPVYSPPHETRRARGDGRDGVAGGRADADAARTNARSRPPDQAGRRAAAVQRRRLLSRPVALLLGRAGGRARRLGSYRRVDHLQGARRRQVRRDDGRDRGVGQLHGPRSADVRQAAEDGRAFGRRQQRLLLSADRDDRRRSRRLLERLPRRDALHVPRACHPDQAQPPAAVAVELQSRRHRVGGRRPVPELRQPVVAKGSDGMKRIALVLVIGALALASRAAQAQGDGGYKLVPNWPHLPAGMYFGLKDAPPPPAEREAQAAARRARGGAPGGAGRAGGAAGEGPTNQPGISGLAIDQHDRIYVFNRGVKPVMVFDTDGNLILAGADQAINGKTINPSWQHSGGVDWDGNVYVIERDAHRIIKLAPKLDKVLLQLGTTNEKGNDATHFNLPSGIAILHNGNIIVTDGYGNNRVVMFDRTGRFIKQVAKGAGGPSDKGTGPGEWNLPHKLAVDA